MLTADSPGGTALSEFAENQKISWQIGGGRGRGGAETGTDVS